MGRSAAEIRAELEALQAELAATQDTGVYQDPSTGRWYVRFPVNGTWTTRRTAPDGTQLRTRDQALVARGEWQAKLERSELVITGTRFTEFWDAYLKSRRPEITARSWDDLRAHGTKRLLPFFGPMLLGRITVQTVHDWRSLMYEHVEAGDIAPKTVNNARVALMGCFKAAVAARPPLMAYNPASEVRPLRVERQEPKYLKLAEIPVYLGAAPDHYRPLAAFLIGTGARVSEAIAVRVDDLDIQDRKARITGQRDGTEKRGTKTQRARSVYFGPRLADTLQTLILQRLHHDVEDGGWLFLCPPPARGRYARRTVPAPPHRKTVHDWHEATLEAAGLPDMPLHGLRHTAAAAWLAAGQGLEFVKRQLGHSTIKTTSDVYGHLEDELRSAGAAVTEARIAEARATGLLLT